MKKFFLNIIYFFFSKIIFLSINFYKLRKIKLFYTDRAGYGDFIFFCLEIRSKLNLNNKIFCFSKIQYDIAKFFFNEKFIAKNFILLPSFIFNTTYLTNKFLIKNKNFTPTYLTRLSPDNSNVQIPISEWWNGTTDSIEFVSNKIKDFEISKKLLEICKKKTLCIFIKNFSHIKNNHLNFQVRQTRDLQKIYKLINILSLKKLNIVILGKYSDNFIKTFPQSIIKKNKNIFLFKDLSNKNSIADQAYLSLNSIGYVGNMSGPTSFFGILNKEAIIIDAASFYSDKYFKNFMFLYKKIYNKNEKILKKFVWQKYYEPKECEIIENTYEEIIESLEFKILKKQNL